MNREFHRYIDLTNLPRYNKDSINWKESINKEVYFEYKELKGYIKILDYIKCKRTKLKVQYKNSISEIFIEEFKKCRLGRVVGDITNDFKIDTGTKFKDNKRNITITDKEYRIFNEYKTGKTRKYYKYKCNKCGYDYGWIEEGNLLRGQGCSCCAGRIIIKGINDIATTDPWIIEYLVNKEDAYKYGRGSHQKVKVKCPDCGRIKNKSMAINNLCKAQSISCSCSDGISYPNKFMFNILEQFTVDFIPEYSPDWIGRKRYDFYIPSLNLIIEMDGGLGHGKRCIDGLMEHKDKETDSYKNNVANKYDIKVVRINCDYINLNRFSFVKKNILNSELIKHFNFNNIDWDKADEFATKNRVKEVCEYYERYKDEMLMKDIYDKFKISNATLISYLKNGNKFRWCNYKDSRSNEKIRVVETGDIFKNAAECEKQSEGLYGIKLNHRGISRVLKGERKHYKNYHFEYVKEVK